MSQLTIPGGDLRIIRLEENSWFQEEKLKALDAQLVEQQKRIDELERSVKFLRGRLESMEVALDQVDSPGGSSGVAEIPPHYQQKPL